MLNKLLLTDRLKKKMHIVQVKSVCEAYKKTF